MFLIVGLGNPGKQYENTRHNVGFETIDYLSALYRIDINQTKHKALFGKGIIQGKKVILAKPQTFMNNSGESIREIVNYYDIDVNNLIVVYDDVDLDVGKLRVRPKGSSGTHNGMRSIVYQLNSEDFPRIRIGIGKPQGKIDMAAYVLGRFSTEERGSINSVVERASIAISSILTSDVTTTMSKFNG